MKNHFLVHDATDSVGVVTVEGVTAGQQLIGWVMDTAQEVRVTALADIPLGHKVALTSLEVGASVLKYGHDIGKVVDPIVPGQHVHVHNVKTRRW